jgi:hypothetical protein
MKKVMFAIATLFAAAQVHAQELTATLTQFRIQPDSSLSVFHIVGGNLSINVQQNELNLVLTPARPACPKGMMCAQTAMTPAFLFAPVQFDLKLNSVEQGACHETIYKASKDLRPVDGSLVKITVVDNSTNICKTLVMLPPTSIVLEEQGLRGKGEKHSFIATSLK